jgi:transposase
MSKAFVGIDVSKEHSTAQGIDSNEKKLFYLRFSMDSTGFAELRTAIKGCAVNLNDIAVAMESTGCYHINLFSFLCAEGLRCAVVNPLLISNFVQGSLRKTKTDKKDAMTIAQFLLHNEKKLYSVSESQDAQDLRDLARERESQSWMIATLKNDLKRLLQSTFPELETLRKNIYTETMLNFVRQYPSARLIRQAKRKDIDKALICPGEKRKRVQISADDLIAAAKRSVASAGVAKELIVSEKATTILYLEEKCEKITEALIEACQAMRIEDLEIMKTLDGVKDITGSTFLAEMGELSNFKSYKSLIAFMGLDPSTNQSGQRVGPSKISKRGNRHLRRVIHIMTMCSVKSDNIFRQYYLRRKAEGLPPVKALMATSHKLIRVIFSMLTHRMPFKKEVAAV